MSNLRKYRESLNISQTTLAKAVGCTQGAIGHWESGRRFPDLKTCRALVACLNKLGAKSVLMTCSRRNTKPLKTFPLLHIPALKKGIKLNHTYGVCIYLHTFNQLLSKEILTYGSCKQTQRGSTNRECVA